MPILAPISSLPRQVDRSFRPSGQVWNIDLTSVGANLQSVTSLPICVEGFGATGTLLLDDIRVYALSREFITPVQLMP